MKADLALLAVALLALVAVPTLPAQVRLKGEKADQLLIDKGEIVYPELAKQTKLQGTVKVEVVVSEGGSVISTKIITGHPLLVTAALDSLKRRKYRPYVVQERPASFVTTTDVVFSLGIPAAEYAAREDHARNYMREEDKCRNLLTGREWSQAEKVCKAAVPLADRMSADRGLTKMGAYEHVGYALLAQQRYAEALEYYVKALEFARSTLKDTDAELAYAYRNLAMANHGLRNLDNALDLYRKAETTLELALKNIESRDLKERYEGSLKEIQRYHLLAAQEAGATADIQELTKRLQAK